MIYVLLMLCGIAAIGALVLFLAILAGKSIKNGMGWDEDGFEQVDTESAAIYEQVYGEPVCGWDGAFTNDRGAA